MLNYRYNLQSLIEMLEQNQQLDIFIADIFHFNLLCDENFGIEETLFDPHITAESKMKFMEEVLKPHLGKNFYEFIAQLVKNNDINFYEFISKKFITLLGKEKNCHFIEVVSPYPLNQEQLDQAKASLTRIQGREVFVYNSISRKILGGFIVKCEEKMLDLSVLGSLEKLKSELKQK